LDKIDPKKKKDIEEDAFDEAEYDDMELLERLESLREDMEDLSINTLAEVVQRINELHAALDKK
jgi:hypothetical protein